MNISAAINFFSIRTASALETAVKNNFNSDNCSRHT